MSLKVTQGVQQANDIWKLAETKNAETYFETGDYKAGPLANRGDDAFKANRMAKMCDNMANDLENVIQDQREYIEDIEISMEEIEKLEADLDSQIEKLESETEELLIKRNNGTITEEEENELYSKNGEIEALQNSFNIKMSDKNSKIASKSQDANRTKTQIAKNYGEFAVEKGSNLFESKDKIEKAWLRAFGKDTAIIEAGNNLVESGNFLLNQVNYSKTLDSEITKKIK